VEDAQGRFDWARPDEDLHGFVNELERPIGTYLYGRRMYQTMTFWESAPVTDATAPVLRDYAQIWRAADKVVYSSTLDSVSSARTRLERRFDPDAVRHLKATSSQDLSIGGADLARQAIQAGLVDEFQLFVMPIAVGGGKPWLPQGVRVELELAESRPFASGVVYLSYRPR